MTILKANEASKKRVLSIEPLALRLRKDTFQTGSSSKGGNQSPIREFWMERGMPSNFDNDVIIVEVQVETC